MLRFSLLFVLVVVSTIFSSLCADNPVVLSPALTDYIEARQSEFDQIPSERQNELAALADYVRQIHKAGEPIRLNFICTHNSRRSHLAQVWATVGASQVGLTSIETFSGGTEATAMNPRIVDTLGRAGFEVKLVSPEDTSNPKYSVQYCEAAAPMLCYSKVYDQSPNPNAGYCAVMVCSDADKHCPIVRGANKRFVIKYDDPKVSDDTPEESQTYDQRCAQIAREMLFAFSMLTL